MSKASWQGCEKGKDENGPVRKIQPLQTKHLATDPAEGPPARLSDLVSLRSKHSSSSLRSLLDQASTLMAHQDRLIKDVNRLLAMEKSVGVYKKASEDF